MLCTAALALAPRTHRRRSAGVSEGSTQRVAPVRGVFDAPNRKQRDLLGRADAAGPVAALVRAAGLDRRATVIAEFADEIGFEPPQGSLFPVGEGTAPRATRAPGSSARTRTINGTGCGCGASSRSPCIPFSWSRSTARRLGCPRAAASRCGWATSRGRTRASSCCRRGPSRRGAGELQRGHSRAVERGSTRTRTSGRTPDPARPAAKAM